MLSPVVLLEFFRLVNRVQFTYLTYFGRTRFCRLVELTKTMSFRMLLLLLLLTGSITLSVPMIPFWLGLAIQAMARLNLVAVLFNLACILSRPAIAAAATTGATAVGVAGTAAGTGGTIAPGDRSTGSAAPGDRSTGSADPGAAGTGAGTGTAAHVPPVPPPPAVPPAPSVPVKHELSATFYDTTCPDVQAIIYQILKVVFKKHKRMAASLLRMHFHDCFVNGCDGSVLLDDTPNFIGEKTAGPNANSLRGFEVIDRLKAAVESACPGVVSCADILAIAAQVSVQLRGGPAWAVYLGRRDSLTASRNRANNDIPPPTSTVSALVSSFERQGLTLRDMVVLSGSHTIGLARCATFSQRIYNNSGTLEPDPEFGRELLIRSRIRCPRFGNGNATLPLDGMTPTGFDNFYYHNLLQQKGLLFSDQVLTYESPLTAELVKEFTYDKQAWFAEFAASMVKMGNIKPLTGNYGEVRKHCRFVNKKPG